MKVTSAKENILKKIRQALANPVPVPFPQSEGVNSVFQPLEKEIEVEFAENFTSLQGKFSFCADERELAGQLVEFVKARPASKIFCNEPAVVQTLQQNGFDHFNSTDLSSCTAAITTCELLIARTGSILLSSALASGRTASVYAPVHICIAYTDQLVYDIRHGLQIMKEKYGGSLPSLISLATGPSRTADIEKTLVVGVHGPKEVYVFLVDRS
ncbi:LutC/YkgG family protein [Aridibaculum aurantiacum]|uniref:LutC/YkgG family protein n=1 Tax=Aridibaculum aurantiacum TaxID=2810307 RepID=UPI001A96E446|nr:LUD domain-containing protein [Aridibaculum aurantiacum]